MLGRILVSGQQCELAKQLVDCDVPAGADVIRAALTALQGGEIGRRHVADVQHVARLLAVPIDGDRSAREHPAREDRDHPALLALKVLASPIDVGVAQDGVGEVIGAAESTEVLLEAVFAGAIW